MKSLSIKSLFCIIVLSVTVLPAYSLEIADLYSKAEIEAVSSIESMRIAGDIDFAGLSGQFEIAYLAPDKINLKIDLGIIKITQSFDGQTAWAIDQNGQILEISGIEKKQIINSVYLIGMAYLIDSGSPGRVVYNKDSLVEDQAYSIFTAYPDGGDSLRLYFNRQNHRLEMVDQWMEDLEATTYFSDFRTISGIEIPFAQKDVSNRPELNSSSTYSEVEINPVLDPSIFSIAVTEILDYSFPEGADSLILPFSYDRHISFEAVVNGKDKASFILDSGAGSIVINKSFAEKLGLKFEGEIPSKGIAGYGIAEFTRIDSISIGGITLYNQVVGVVDLDQLNLSIEGVLGGILGFDLLSRFPVKIRYAAGELIFYNPANMLSVDSTFAINFDYYMKIPVVEASYGGVIGRFVVDLGNPFGLILHDSFVEENGLEETFSNVEELESAVGGIGGPSTAYAATGTYLIIGDAKIESPPLLVAGGESGLVGSKEVNGNIGNLLLKDFSIILDYAAKKIYILPSGT